MTQRAGGFWTSCSDALLAFAYPRKCSLCGLSADTNPCVQCLGEMTPNLPAVTYASDGDLDFTGSLFRYPGRAGQAVRMLKYHGRTGLARFMAERIYDAVEGEGVEFDLAVPIPIHWFRLASRGFNQADLLASNLPKKTFALRRTRPTKPLAGLSPVERLRNLDGAFEVVGNVEGKIVMLIDDVVTSGQTARECAKVLRRAGAREVGILAFCGDT